MNYNRIIFFSFILDIKKTSEHLHTSYDYKSAQDLGIRAIM